MSDMDNYSRWETMNTEGNRLNSFKNWSFDETKKCSASKMAEAGFYHCPTQNEPDAVTCFVCFKELDGWEPNDEPWEEHASHAKYCLFAQLKKPQKVLTIEEVFKIEEERKTNKMKRRVTGKLQEFRTMVTDLETFILQKNESLKSNKKSKSIKT